MRTTFFFAVLFPVALWAQDPSLNCHDGKESPPRLQIVLNVWGLQAYPAPKEEWTEERKVREIAAAGFDAFDVWIGGAKEADFSRWKKLADRHQIAIGVETEILRPEDADAAIEGAKRLGSVYLDAHVAGYFTPEAEAEELLRNAVDRFRKANMALAIQTHRGRVTQDLLRSVRYAKAIPGLRFDLDLSHYFVGGSIGGGGVLPPEAEEALAVLMERAIMLDGRVSNGEQVQVDHRNPAYSSERDRFASMWKDGMKRWLQTARRGDVFPFRIELGPPATPSSAGMGARSPTAGNSRRK
jgi:hypothetical protein